MREELVTATKAKQDEHFANDNGFRDQIREQIRDLQEEMKKNEATKQGILAGIQSLQDSYDRVVANEEFTTLKLKKLIDLLDQSEKELKQTRNIGKASLQTFKKMEDEKMTKIDQDSVKAIGMLLDSICKFLISTKWFFGLFSCFERLLGRTRGVNCEFDF